MSHQQIILNWAILNGFVKFIPNLVPKLPYILRPPCKPLTKSVKTGIIHMPTTQAHIEKQSITQLTLSYLQQSQNSPQHADWIVTLAFYKVLHAVDSYLAKQGIHPKGHKLRNQQVQNHLGSIHREYYALYRASRRARYDEYTYRDNPQEVTILVNHALDIEEYIETLLESP